MGLLTFWKYFCDNFHMRAQDKMAIMKQAKPNKAREESKDKLIASFSIHWMGDPALDCCKIPASEQCIF